ncbi:MAG: cyclic nucleotide-binding domain-containing protein [Bdellovibrio sp.]|nr:cyclic nucleotide-binding domain-containing protein [Bdellovibrio sp.]
MYTIKSLPAGEVLLTEGTIQPYIFILKSGLLVVMKSSGRDVKTIGEIKPGEFIGEMAYLGSEKTHQATVIAMNDCELVQIEGDQFFKVLSENQVWLKALLRSFVIRLEESNGRKVSK